MKTFPLTYVIILNWNKSGETLECLESLFQCVYPHFKVLLVDNHSQVDPVDMIKNRFPQVEIIRNKANLGFTGGNNIGLKYAIERGADYVWLLNNDTIVEKESLSHLIKLGESNEKIGLLSPFVYFCDSPERIEFCGRLVEWEKKRIFELDPEDRTAEREEAVGEKTVLTGTALLIKKKVVETIGYLDESFFAYYEDEDYSIRALKEGFLNRVCRPARVYHKSPLLNAVRAPYYFYYMTRNRYLFRAKHFGHHSGRLANFMDLLFHMFRYSSICAIENKYPAVRASLEGSWAALRGVRGPWEERIAMPGWLKTFIYPVIFIFSTNYLLRRFVKNTIRILVRARRFRPVSAGEDR